MKRTGMVRAAGYAAFLLLGAHSAAAVTGRWESIGVNAAGGGNLPTPLAIAFTGRGLVMASGMGIFRNTGEGLWSPLLQVPLGSGIFGFPDQFGAFQWLTTSNGSPDVYVAGLYSGGVYRSVDGGATWDIVLVGSGSVSGASAPSSPQVLFASVQTASRDQATTYKSSDGGATWTPLSGLGASLVYAFAVDSASSEVVYASVGSGGSLAPGLYRSLDGGGSWQPLSGGLPNDTFPVIAADPSTTGVVYGGTGASGVYRSADGGDTWTAINEGLENRRISALAVDPQTPSIVYVGTFRGAYRSDDSGGHWLPLGLGQDTVYSLAVDPASPSNVYAGITGALERITLGPTTPCIADAQSLCLNGGRFRVQTTFRTNQLGSGGVGGSVPISDSAGGLWFFDAANVELVVKVLDGTSVNGHFWVFYAALTTVEFTITVTDTVTGAIQSYFFINGYGSAYPASVADILALPASGPPASGGSSPITERPAASGGLCTPDASTLCLLGGRFQARVTWKSGANAPEASAPSVQLTDQTGYYWFFQQPNVEIVLKVLDGTAVNGHFWVFYAALSNVAYTVTVTDLQTGALRVYDNQAGQLLGVDDTSAF